MKEFLTESYGPAFWISLICGLISFIFNFRKINEIDRPWYLACIVLAAFTPIFNILAAFICLVFALGDIIDKVDERLKKRNKNG
jgi:hypothetical protein